MPRECGVLTLSKAFKKLSPSTHHAVAEKLFYPKRERCMVSSNWDSSIDHINRKFPHQSEWVKLIKLLPWCSYSQLDYTPTIINIIDNLLLHGWKNISLLENRIAQFFLCVSRDLNYIIKAALNRRPLGHVSLSLCFSSKFDLIRVY